MRRAAIIGYGAMPPAKYSDKPESELAMEVIKRALADAQVAKEQIEGLFTTPDLIDTIGLQPNTVCEYMRITPRAVMEMQNGGTAGGLAIKYAMDEIMLGRLEVAVCYAAEKEGTNRWFKHFGVGRASPQFEPVALQAYGGPGVVWAYAISTRRYMHETGAGEEHFALAVVRDRKNAVKNPLAAFREPITVEDVMKSPPLCTPLKRLDASTSLDGANALVIASEEFARKHCEKPVYIAGVGEYHDCTIYFPTDDAARPISRFPSVRGATERALKAAGITIGDVDVAEIYAPFSPWELIIPEEMGWFKRGGMAKALEKGETEVGGRIPINTDGGLLSRGHPWCATPFYETINIVKQLRGEAENQVDNPQIGLIHAEGGMLNNSVVIIFRKDRP